MKKQSSPKRFAFGVFITAFSLLATITIYAATLVVSPANLQAWQIQITDSVTAGAPTVTFVAGPATPPLGTGSARFTISADGNDAAQLRHPGYHNTTLNQLTALGYSTYVEQDGSGGQAPYIILQIDTDGDAGIEDLLFFEPFYQSATFCPSNPQTALVTGQWQTWNALNGCWYSVFGTAGSGPGTNTKPLSAFVAALPTGKIVNSSPSGLGGVRLVTGFGAGAWDNFIGYADAFIIGTTVSGVTTTFDFEEQAAPTAAAVAVSGRVTTPRGRGIRNVSIILTDSAGNTRTARTTAFGYYRFDGIAAGETVTLSAKARQFRFEQSTIVRTTNDSISDADFVSVP